MTKETRESLNEVGQAAMSSIRCMVREYNDATTDEARESAEQTILEDPLEIQVREGWHGVGEKGNPDEYFILLSTGGPASRIIGDLSMGGEPVSARLEVQDWGTPWVEYFPNKEDQDVLLDYVRRFYWGD
jgi:hypothetical protein